ncbi:MAG: hypothetical protein LBH35_00115 [Treponema sp.]|jgi:predicted aspartyl protease|nr:hypothetical protein [Treponema sp.]
MGEVHAEVTLVNLRGADNAGSGFIPESEVRRLAVSALVDTGAWPLVINEETRQKLGLRVEEPRETTVTEGVKIPGRITEYVEIRRKDRKTACEAVVLSNKEGVLLGAYPLEGMDLMAHPQRQEVIGAHGGKIRNAVKQPGQGPENTNRRGSCTYT